MTREEYEKLVKGALSFKDMSAGMQAAVLAATGLQMEKYIQMFQEEKTMIAKAFQSFQSETEQVVGDYKINVQKGKKRRLVAAETSTHKKEIVKAEKLLKNL